MYRTYYEINNHLKKNPPSLEIDKNAKTTLYKPLDLKTTKLENVHTIHYISIRE